MKDEKDVLAPNILRVINNFNLVNLSILKSKQFIIQSRQEIDHHCVEKQIELYLIFITLFILLSSKLVLIQRFCK